MRQFLQVNTINYPLDKNIVSKICSKNRDRYDHQSIKAKKLFFKTYFDGKMLYVL